LPVPELTPLVTLMLLSFGTMIALMFLVWLLSRKLNNAGIVDVAWGFGFVIIALIDFIWAYFHGWGWLPRNLVVLAMVALWSLRLGIFLAMRFKRMWPAEDARYTTYRQAWKNPQLGLLLAFEMQAVLLAALTLPYALAMVSAVAQFSIFELSGIALFLIALIGESVADHQLETFKKNSANHGQVCQSGLWYYSRHPNYFFEWMVWLAFFVFSLAFPYGWSTFYCPILMLWFLLKVTGVKATEEQALRSKGEAYAAYQRTTSAFVPWFKKGVT